MARNSANERCVCQICICGQHRCNGAGHISRLAKSVSDMQIAGGDLKEKQADGNGGMNISLSDLNGNYGAKTQDGSAIVRGSARADIRRRGSGGYAAGSKSKAEDTNLRASIGDLHTAGREAINVVERPVARKLGETLRIGSGKMDMVTTVRGDYGQFTPKRPFIHRTNTNLKMEGDVQSVSHSHRVHQSGQGDRYAAKKLGETLAVNPGEFQDYTTLRGDYKPQSPTRPYLHRNDTTLHMEGSVSTMTHSKDIHHAGSGDRYPMKKLGEALQVSPGDIQRESTFGSDYKPLSPTRPYLHRNNTELKMEGELGRTTHSQETFRQGSGDRHQAKKLGETLKVAEGDFAKTTTLRGDFSPQSPRRPFLHRNNTNLHMEGEIDGSTHYQSTFQNGSASAWPAKKLGHTLEVAEGDIQKSSLFHNDFPPLPAHRPIIKKLGATLKTDGEFDGTTGYAETYKEFRAERPVVKKMVDNLSVSEGKLMASPVMRSDYKEFRAERPVIKRLQTNLDIDTGAIDFDSINKVSFKPFVYAKPSHGGSGMQMDEIGTSTQNRVDKGGGQENAGSSLEGRGAENSNSNLTPPGGQSFMRKSQSTSNLACNGDIRSEDQTVLCQSYDDNVTQQSRGKRSITNSYTDTKFQGMTDEKGQAGPSGRSTPSQYVSKDIEEYTKHLSQAKSKEPLAPAGVTTSYTEKPTRQSKMNKTAYLSSIVLGGNGSRQSSAKVAQRYQKNRPPTAMKMEGERIYQSTVRSDYQSLPPRRISPEIPRRINAEKGVYMSKDFRERKDTKSVLGNVIHQSDFSGMACPAGFLEMPAKTKFSFSREKDSHKFYLPVLK